MTSEIPAKPRKLKEYQTKQVFISFFAFEGLLLLLGKYSYRYQIEGEFKLSKYLVRYVLN